MKILPPPISTLTPPRITALVIVTLSLTACSYGLNESLNSVNEVNSEKLASKTATITDITIKKDLTKNASTSNNTRKPSNKNTNKKTATANHGLTEDFDTLTINPSDNDTGNDANKKLESDWQWDLPPYFPTPRVPKDNPMSKAKVELGRHLFYDTRLSVSGNTSCESCHFQVLAFTDGKAHAVGATGELHPRSSIGLANVAYLPTLTWANPAITKLEDQLLTPIFGDMPIEMGLTDETFDKVQASFAKDTRYQRMFREAFADSAESGKNYSEPADYSLVEIAQAISSFERSIISADSKFDKHIQGKAQLTDSEMRGKTLFFGEKAECHHCHGSLNFNDQMIHANSRIVPVRFHNTGMYNLDEQGSYIENNEGLFDITSAVEDKGKFRAPSLRNVALTAPYNHDGSTKTLENVVANYANGGRVIQNQQPTKIETNANKSDKIDNEESSIIFKNSGDGRFNPNKSDLIVRIDLTADEQTDIVSFLRTLTDETLLTNPNYSNPWTADPSIDTTTN